MISDGDGNNFRSPNKPNQRTTSPLLKGVPGGPATVEDVPYSHFYTSLQKDLYQDLPADVFDSGMKWLCELMHDRGGGGGGGWQHHLHRHHLTEKSEEQPRSFFI